ncbi:MAG: HNH endonuclease [Candidatus Saccharimonas sp.]|nr:HNH endonuclease [Candidatus Saccharimonas sp.]
MRERRRRTLGVILIVIAMSIMVVRPESSPGPSSTTVTAPNSTVPETTPTLPPAPTSKPVTPVPLDTSAPRAIDVLARLAIKGRAPKTDYQRVQFGDGWLLVGTCDMRNIILNRDLLRPAVSASGCKVTSGTLTDPYTGKTILFERGPDTSDLIQIDHVVALSNAWQTGAQLLSFEQRKAFANDPLELLAVDGNANQAKGDGDAATWLPANKAFRCQYVARQIAVKAKYSLWVTQAEHDAMAQVLSNCPGQTVPIVK